MKIVCMTNRDELFYPTLGPFLSRRAIVDEIGAPIWDDEGKKWFVAMRGRKVLGFAAIRDVRGQKKGLVSAYVLPEYRKQGVYSALVAARLEATEGPLSAVATPMATPMLKKAGLKEAGKRGKFTVLERPSK